MGAKNLSEFGNAIRAELYCDDTVHAPTQMDRAIAKTEALLGRLIPKKNIVETTITIDRAAETFAIGSSAGVTAYKPIKYDSETITSKPVGTTYTRGTHYTINYMTGVITEITGMDDTDYLITYKQDEQRLDVSSLIAANAIKITRIEYPVGEQPPAYLGSFDIIEDFLILHKDDLLTEDKHLRIYYDSLWTAATASTDGEYPTHLDDAIIVGAAGQCLIFKAEEYVIAAVTELELVNAAADSMATPLSRINEKLSLVAALVTAETGSAGAALAKVAQYLETNVDGNGGGVDNAQVILARITDEATTLRTRIDSLLSKSNDYIFGDTEPSALKYLESGDAKIATLNVSDRVAEKYADYARTTIQLFTGLVAESIVRLDNLRTYIEEAQAWMRMGDTFLAESAQRLGQANTLIAEAAQRIGEVNAWAVQADRYTVTSRQYMDIAGRYLASGRSKINEFYAMLGFRPEIQHTRAAAGQPTQY